MSNSQGSTANVIAAICSFVIPGLGQLVQGRLFAAFFYFVTIGTCYFFQALVLPLILGAILHLFCIISAARFQPQS